MTPVGLFFGTLMGNTEEVAEKIQQHLGSKIVTVRDILNSQQAHVESYNYLIFGIPTWYIGQALEDWIKFFPSLNRIDFSDKTVAIYGLGDQGDYEEYFCDAIKDIYDIVKARGAKVVGHWPRQGYNFSSTKPLLDENTLIGLCIDEDIEPDLTAERVRRWCEQLYREMDLARFD